jgi:hypothetical protein
MPVSKVYIYKTDANAIARLKHDPNVNWTAESYFMMKVNKNSKCVKYKTGNSLKIMGQAKNMKI